MNSRTAKVQLWLLAGVSTATVWTALNLQQRNDSSTFRLLAMAAPRCSATAPGQISRGSLLTGVNSADPRVALAAIRLLAQAPGDDALAVLAEASRSSNPSIRIVALQALIAGASPKGIALARAAIQGKDSNLAAAAAESLVALDRPSARQIIADSARSADPNLRLIVARALALANNPDAKLQSLMTLLAADPEFAVRKIGLGALSQIGTPPSVDPLLQVATQGRPADRAYVLGLLGNVEDPRAGPLIAAAIYDPAPEVASAAIDAARYRLGPDVDGPIVTRLLDPAAPQALKMAAARALRQHQGSMSKQYAAQIVGLIGEVVPSPTTERHDTRVSGPTE